MEDLQFVHVELKRDTWASQKMSVRDPFDAVEVARTLIENLDREMVVNIHMATDGPSNQRYNMFAWRSELGSYFT